MSLRHLVIKKFYDSDTDDILNSFFIPALSNSVLYQRLAGFFSSSSLAIAARGIAGLVSNKGKMQLVCSPKLQKEDVEAIIEGHKNRSDIIENCMLQSLIDIENLEDELLSNHIKALGWMIRNGFLEIKVAIVKDSNDIPLNYIKMIQSGIFHQKVGILEDAEGNKMSFSGSDNETAYAWQDNIEEFKVFRSWVESEKEYLESDCQKFLKFWQGKGRRVEVMDVPIAVRQRLIEISPDSFDKLELKKETIKKGNTEIKLYSHQISAVKSWLNNAMKGIFEMATGSGKTFAALGCVKEACKKVDKLAIIISCPYLHLSQQWEKEIKKFGIQFPIILADSSRPNWKDRLSDYLDDLYIGHEKKIIILTTHSTLSSSNFLDIIQLHSKGIKVFIIVDEVHGIGAKQRRTALLDIYELRLGLSATPKRWFDQTGTEKIYSYFGDVVFEYGLEDAIKDGHLVPFRYIPKFVSLDEDELVKYSKLTKVIIEMMRKSENEDEKDEAIEKILFKRANITKNANQKYYSLKNILDEIIKTQGDIRGTIIYCSPQQINQIMRIANGYKIKVSRFTMDEGTRPSKAYSGLSEREYILKEFAAGNYQMLIAMKCLDEGVDIPPVRNAILMASSGNPREYIQRIGRIIRRYEGKIEAFIYDIIVAPSYKIIPSELYEIEHRIFEKELARYREIAKIAINNIEALRLINEMEKKV